MFVMIYWQGLIKTKLFLTQTTEEESEMQSTAKCIVCSKELRYIEFSNATVASGRLGAMHEANDFLILGGFGSRHDEYFFKAFICDDCLEMAILQSRVHEVEKGDDHE